MSRNPSPEQKRALKIWLKSGRTMKPKEIAEEVGVSPALVRKWKSVGKWERLPDPRRGPPRGNKNAKGNNGGAPPGNDNAVTHGLFRKFLPDDEETREIYDMTADLSPLDILWEGIRIKWTNFLRAQKIQYVRDNEDITKVLKRTKPTAYGIEREWEFQQPWDKQSTAMTSQASAFNSVIRAIKQYEDMLRSIAPAKVKEEQRLRVEKLKAEVQLVKAEAKALGDHDDDGVTIIDDIPRGDGP